jgi:hypothetical protein
VVFRKISEAVTIFWDGNADGSGYQAVMFVSRGLGKDGVYYLSRRQAFESLFYRDDLAFWREDARYLDDIKGSYLGVAKCELEAHQFFLVLSDPLRQDELAGNRHIVHLLSGRVKSREE